MPGVLGELLPLLFAGQLLEPARRLLDLLGEPALRRAAATGRRAERPPALLLRFLLLPARQLLQLLEQLVDLLVAAHLLRAIRRLVLIRELVEVHLEHLGQLAGHGTLLSAPAATTAAAVHADLRFVLLLRLLEEAERAVLGRKRGLGADGVELLLGHLHLGDGLRQQLRDLLERRVRRDEAARHARHEPFHLFAQARLRESDDDRVLLELVRGEGLPIPLHVERGRDHLTLLLGERGDVTGSAAHPAATATGHGLRRAEVLLERTHADEIEVARGHALLAARGVGRARVVGHGVAGLHAHFFEIERVPGRHLWHPLRTLEERQRLFGSAVHGVDELEVLHAVVVGRGGLHEHFLDGRRRGVAPGLGKAHPGSLVGQDVDRVLRRGGHMLPGRRVELDAIEAVLLHAEAARQRPVSRHLQRHGFLLVQADAPARDLHRRGNLRAHLRAREHGDVAAVLDLLRLQARVGREAVLELQLLDVRQVDDREREDRRRRPVGLDLVLDRRGDVEEQPLEGTRAALGQRQLLERLRRVAPHEQRRLLGVEALQRGRDLLVRALGHSGGPRRHDDLERHGRFNITRDEERRQRVAQHRRAGAEDGEAEDEDGRRGDRVAFEPALLHLLRRIAREARLDGGFDQPRNERGRPVVGVDGRVPGGVDRADDRGVEAGRVLLEVERYLFIRGLPAQRTDHEHGGDDGHGRDERDPQPDDERGIVAAVLNADRRGNQQQHAEREGGGGAAQCELQPPAAAHVADDGRQVAWFRHLARPLLFYCSTLYAFDNRFPRIVSAPNTSRPAASSSHQSR